MHTDSWYSRGEITEINKAKCPECKKFYILEPYFDHLPKVCVSCKTTLIEWHLLRHFYVINPYKAPSIVKHLLKYLEDKIEQDAVHELEELLNFLEIEKT